MQAEPMKLDIPEEKTDFRPKKQRKLENTQPFTF